MTEATHYVIRGGVEGRERLRILSRVMHASTTSLLDRLDLRDGIACLDVGCGGGDVTLELARRVAPHGKALGTDIDPTKLQMARQEARQQGVTNVEFQSFDIREARGVPEYDFVYARFLLSHLVDPASAIKAFLRQLRPGGRVAVVDIDFSGGFTYPGCEAFTRYQDLYCAVVRRNGGDPHIGPRLPLLLRDCGFEDVGMSVVQPTGTQGEVKLLNPITMENIADSVVQEGLATREEIEDVVRELYRFAADPNTVAGLPRIVQAWGRCPR